MALKTEKEILQAVRESKGRLTSLHTRFEDDYKLVHLEEYKREGYESITANDPRTLALKIISLLAEAERTIRIPLELDSEDERNAKSNAERFYCGVLNLADSRLQALLQPNIQSQLGFHTTVRGWYAIRAFMRKEEDEVIPDVAVWDALNTYWDIGSRGMLWVCHTRTASESQIQAEYNVKAKKKKGNIVYDLWDDAGVNSVLIDDKFVLGPNDHGLKHPPVLVGQVGSVPFIESAAVPDTIKDVGESVLSSNRGLYEPLNKIMSDYMTIVDEGVHNPYAVLSSDGKKGLERSPWSLKGAEIKLDASKGEDIKKIFEPTMPRDVLVLWQAIERRLAMGGLNPLAFGILEREISGYGISLLHHAAEAILIPPKEAMQEALEWLSRELLTQYVKGKFGKLRLRGRDGTNEYFDVELEPEKVKGDWFPEVRLVAKLPMDEMAQYTKAQMAVESGLLSRETAGDRLLGIQDTDAENQKKEKERAQQLPGILERRMAAALYKEGGETNTAFADILIARAKSMEAQARVEPSPYQRRRREARGEAVESQFAQGVPRSLLPSEEMGKIPTQEG